MQPFLGKVAKSLRSSFSAMLCLLCLDLMLPTPEMERKIDKIVKTRKFYLVLFVFSVSLLDLFYKDHFSVAIFLMQSSEQW